MTKRLFDILCIFAFLPCCVPLLALVSLLVAGRIGRPVFFLQRRIGIDEKEFSIVKFRTMSDSRDAAGKLLGDDVRLTSFGKLLRASSLDELPELWNVLRGEMSLVGPRPLLPEYLPLYSERQARRHEVRPGITGWAQVNGRNTVDWNERFEMDVWYVENQSLWLDLKILLMTVCVVLKRSGVSAEGHATMPAFTGNESESSS